MAEAITTIEIVHGDGEDAVTVGDRLILGTTLPNEAVQALADDLSAIAGGMRSAKVRARVDKSTEAQASLALTVTQTNVAVDEYIDIQFPQGEKVRLTAKATESIADLQFKQITSDTVCAASIRDVINGNPRLNKRLSASESSGVVTITSKEYGTIGNNIQIIDGTTNGISPAGGNLAGGLDASNRATGVLTLTFANIDADETVSIGNVTLTWKASASGENQVDIGANLAAATTNLVAKINAHSSLLGLVTATGVTATGVITLTWLGDPRLAAQIKLASSDATAVAITTQTTAGTGVTLTNDTATTIYSLGAP
jgi:outer membrane lipoprotein SlyB